MFNEYIRSLVLPWQESRGTDDDVVLDSRIRLARNMKNRAFPERASAEDKAVVCEAARACIPGLNKLGKGQYEALSVNDMSDENRDLAAARRIITPTLAKKGEGKLLFLRQDAAASLAVNETDHFVINTIVSGSNVRQAASEAFAVDNVLEGQTELAFHEDFGYLTSMPAMTGTGLFIGVSLHLPGLIAAKKLRRIMQGITKFGFGFSGVYSGRSTHVGNVFRVVNQMTLGISEEDLLDRAETVVGHIIEEERECRRALREEKSDLFFDRLYRSYGVLTQARLMEQEEALNLLSDFRLAVTSGLIDADLQTYAAMVTAVDSAYVSLRRFNDEDPEEKERARLLRSLIKKYVRREP